MSTNKLQQLQRLIHNNNPPLCCLCLNVINEEIKCMQVYDEVHLATEEYSEENMLMSDIINDVLHQEDFVSSSVCNNCVASLFHSYKFIKMCTTVAARLNEFVDGATSCLENPDQVQFLNSERVFISTDVNSLQSVLYYDRKKKLPYYKKCPELKRALQRFQEISYPECMEKYICDYCGKTFRCKRYLVQHITWNCRDTKTICNTCGVIVLKRSLQQHQRSCRYVHDGDSTIPNVSANNKYCLCNLCGKRFLKTNMKRHMESHDPNHKYVCINCGKEYRWLKGYMNHVKNEACLKPRVSSSEPKAFKCTFCKSQYSTYGLLRYHMRIHSDNKDDYYECTWCQKRFPSKVGLTCHTVKHTKQKNWKCEICGGKFVTKPSLTYHIRTHTGEKPYECELCDLSFLSASRRRDHVKAVHLPPVECVYCHKMITPSGLARHKRRHLNAKNNLCKLQGLKKSESE